MSDIDFQNGFIVGMATRGLTVTRKEVYSPIPLTVNTGYGIEIYNKITIVFNKTLNTLLAGNETAFTVLGHDSSNEIVEYAVSNVELFSGYTLVLTTDNFSTNRGTLLISYDAAVGNLSGITSLTVQTFSRTCAVLGIYEINIGLIVPEMPTFPTEGIASDYQEWEDYPDSPLDTATYPNQEIIIFGRTIIKPKLILAPSSLYRVRSGNYDYYYMAYDGTYGKMYDYSGGVWVFNRNITTTLIGNWANNYDYPSIDECNVDVYNESALTTVFKAQTTPSSSPNPEAALIAEDPIYIPITLTVPDVPSITESDLLE